MPGIDAGDFGAWLLATHAALRGSGGSAVPCGDCTGCCTSGYSIEVRPGDAAALRCIPASALSGSITRAAGHWTVRPDGHGVCPMLDCGRCSIYAERPQTCRDYDCRVFAAAGIEAGGADKSVINERVRQWRFRFSREQDVLVHDAIRAAAHFIREGRAYFPAGSVPRTPLGIAALAVRVYPVFLPPGPPADPQALARAVLETAAAFDRGAVHADQSR